MDRGMSRQRVRAAGAVLASITVAACLIACSPVGAGGEPSAQRSPSLPSTPTPAPTSDLRPEIRSSAIDAPTDAVVPQALRIPSLGVDMAVVPVGIAEGDQMELPEDPAIAGWYRFGPDAASTAGNLVLAAHVDSVDYPIGPLAGLRDVAAGETIAVAAADGADRGYVIESVTFYEKSALPTDEIFRRDGDPALIVITCGGPFDSSTGHYRDNVVAVARLQ